MNYREELISIVMEAELSTLSEFSNTMYQVYGKLSNTIIIKVCQYTFTAKGNVTRTTVAEVEIHSNESKFVFKQNVTVETLWPGIQKLLL